MTRMTSTDFHCDVLWKLLENSNLSFINDSTDKLDVTLPRLQQAGSIMQTFAVYIPDEMEKTMVPILSPLIYFTVRC